ncbi:protein phosphatase 2C domain-containing protein [Streptomyces sp. NPDC047315]|uniref:protein phosphatase 2C domain-containing protein n=1 Tax=Streptomyces sp. NPDC047315 TaxID=3155142 RepID=UPI0033C76D7C
MTHGFSGRGGFDADRDQAPRAQLPPNEGEVLRGEGLRGGRPLVRYPVPTHAAGPGPGPGPGSGRGRAQRSARRRRNGRRIGVALFCLSLIAVGTVLWRAQGLVTGVVASLVLTFVYVLIEEFQRKDDPSDADRAPGRPAEMWPAHVDPYPPRPAPGRPYPQHPVHGGPHHLVPRASVPVSPPVSPHAAQSEQPSPPSPPSPPLPPSPPSVPDRPARGPDWPRPEVRLPEPLPAAPSPPRLHRKSKTSALPWRLPAAPAPPAMTADAATVGDLEVRAASLIGPGHRSDPTHAGPRQDAYRLGRDGRSAHLIVAVADGMSDSAHADVAAAVAVSALVNTVRQRLDEGDGPRTLDTGQVFLEAAQQVYAAAEQRGWSDEDVRTVALAAVLPTRPDADGGRTLWLARVGDPSGWYRGSDRWKPLFGAKKGGFDHGKLRHFLPHTPQQAESRRIEVGRGGVLALTTDGVGDALAQLPVAAGWFHRQWARPVTAHDLLLHIGYEAQQRNDDRTAVLVWWAPSGEPR